MFFLTTLVPCFEPEVKMAAQSPKDEEYNLYMSENGHLSFENPNYQMEPLARIDAARMEDHLNSNIQPGIPPSVFEEIRQVQRQDKKNNRKDYASLDVGLMGVGLNPVTNLDNKLVEEKLNSDKVPEEKQEPEVESDKLVESVTEKENKDEDEVEVVRRPKKHPLPPGWEKHCDENGDYYWHVKSGTIQRDPPPPPVEGEDGGEARKRVVRDVRTSIIYDDDFEPFIPKTSKSATSPKTMSKSCTSSSIMDMAKDSTEQKRRSLPPCKEGEEPGVKPMQVRDHIVQLTIVFSTTENLFVKKIY